jgi:chromate transporter
MPDSPTENSTPDSGASPGSASRPTLFAIFLAFAGASVAAFGGALPWVRRAVVEQRGWMTPAEFNEAFSLAQFLPGPNALNFSVVFGSRVHGPIGSIVAFSGLLGPPLVIVIALAALYDRFGDIAVLNQILSGVAAAAAGLMIAFCAKMIQPLLRQRDWTMGVALVGFVCVAIIQWPLPIVFVVLAPVSVVLAWFKI